MKQKLLLLSLGLFLSLACVHAQTNQTMTNSNVIKLVKGKMDNDIILSKIETSICKFDVSDDVLMSLKSSGVPNNIVKAMIEKTNGKKSSEKGEAPLASNPDKESGLEPTTLNEVYYLDADSHSLKSLEKGKVAFTQKGNAFTGKVQSNFELKGAKSPILIAS